MGLVHDLFLKVSTGPKIVEALYTAQELFPRGAWAAPLAADVKAAFDRWTRYYNEFAKSIAWMEDIQRQQADYYRFLLEGAWGDWAKYIREKGANVDLDRGRAILDTVIKSFQNLNGFLPSLSQEYENLSSTMLKIAAAGVWNRESASLGMEESLERTAAKMRVVSEFGKIAAFAAVPPTLQMDPQENPAAYWGSKILEVFLSPQARADSTAVFDLLKELHAARVGDGKLSDKQQIEKLNALADSVGRLVLVKEGTGRMLLPVLAEATREALDRPRGVRQAGPDRPSRPLTEQEKDALRREVERWRR